MTADQFRALRESLGLTQAALAELLGISQAAVSMMETGAREVSRRTEVQMRALTPRKQKQRTG